VSRSDARLARIASISPDDFNLYESGLPAPEVHAIGQELTAILLGLTDTDHRTIASMPLDGNTIAGIAARLGLSLRTVNRRLEAIRDAWASSGLIEGLPVPDMFRDRRWKISDT